MVVIGKAHADIVAPGHPGQVGQPGERVNGWRVRHIRRPRPARAHARHRNRDHARVALRHRLPVEPPAIEHAHRKVIDDHIGLVRQITRDLLRLRTRQVQLQQPLVAVPHRVVGRFGTAAGHRPRIGRDLDHIRAQIAQNARTERPRQHVREIEHANAVERPRRRSGRSLRHQPHQPNSSSSCSPEIGCGSLGSPPIRAGVSASW